MSYTQAMSSLEAVREQALALDEDDRRILMCYLEESLPPPDPDVAEAWAAEIKRRLEAFHRGETTAVDWDEAEWRIFDADD